jgi:hypothetical protein
LGAYQLLHSPHSLARFPSGRIDTGKNVAKPPEPEKPKQTCEQEMDESRENPALQQLTQPGNKKARKCRYYVTS